MDIDRIAVVGAGLMGHGIAQTFAQAGLSVCLLDTSLRVLEKAIGQIQRNLQISVELGDLSAESAAQSLARIQITESLAEAVAEAEFIAGVATPEDIDLIARFSFGLRMPLLGPLETVDLAGLDLIVAIQRYLLPDLNQDTEPSPIVVDKVTHVPIIRIQSRAVECRTEAGLRRHHRFTGKSGGAFRCLAA